MKTNKALLLAGFTAITLNTIMLKAAKSLHIKAESGGLLKLVLRVLPQSFSEDPIFRTGWFWLAFHFLTGGIMVLSYFFIFADLKIGRLVKAVLLSLFPWLINSFIVLPLIGQGLFGADVLPLSGIFYFFMANVLFGFSLVCIFEFLRNNNK